MDPMIEKLRQWSICSNNLNNPIKLVDPTGMEPENIIVGGQVWEPGASYEGQDEFGAKLFADLNSLYANIQEHGIGNVKTFEAQGNVILDFVGPGAIGDVTIVETPGGTRTAEDGTLIEFITNQIIHVDTSMDKRNVEGD